MPSPEEVVRSEEVDEILGSVPSWVTRVGTSVLWLIFIALIALSWFIRYPDVVPSRVKITAQEPPVRLMAHTSGRLARLLVADGESVSSGTWLAVLENPAQLEDMRRLEALLPEIERRLHDPDQLAQVSIELPATATLGPLHIAYAALVRSVLVYRLFRSEAYYDHQLALLDEQLARQRQLVARMRKQIEIVAAEQAQSTGARDRARRLHAEGLAPVAEVESAESLLQQKLLREAEMQVSVLGQELQGQEYEKTRMELRRDREERSQELALAIQESYKRVYNELLDWEQRFVIKSPVDGRVTLHSFWSDHQYVSAGEEVLAVMPERNHLVGRIELGQRNSGKVQVGQRVLIKLDGYPFHEYGVLRGAVQSIAPLSHGDDYMVQVAFAGDELRSSFGRPIEFKDGMQGSADIVTEDLRLIERILHHVFYYLTHP
ncbi:HlyD family efflux transporter periplasmic adaptor subunit [Sorangium sp. So ce385]|uniref:HlyD family efflux transporter periplasmic adaptor subunit n=1 Tax=Sorangium sp. So ce385 TaxID=3133308 RepID=UPI003F5B8957